MRQIGSKQTTRGSFPRLAIAVILGFRSLVVARWIKSWSDPECDPVLASQVSFRVVCWLALAPPPPEP